jgi:hypothetical protein
MTLQEKLKKEGFSNCEYLEQVADDFAIGFANWYFEKLTVADASKWFGFSDKDMLNAYKKEQGINLYVGSYLTEEPKQEIISSEEDAKIFIDALINISEPNEKLKEGFKKFNKQETLEDIKLEEVVGSRYCQYSVIENKLSALYRNQEQILKAVKMLNNGK